jgi:hypothetical protein
MLLVPYWALSIRDPWRRYALAQLGISPHEPAARISRTTRSSSMIEEREVP